MAAIQSTKKIAFLLCWVTLGLMLLGGVVGGFANMAASRDPGWGSVFFIFGAAKALLYTVPAGVLLYVGFTLLAGLIAFLRIRLRKSR